MRTRLFGLEINRGLILFVLVVITLCLYYNTLSAPFQWCMHSLVPKQEYIKDLKSIPFFFTFDYWQYYCFHAGGDSYRPIRNATWAVDYWLWQNEPLGWHISNLLFHIGCVVLIYLLTEQIFRKKGISFITALLFAIHPVHTQVVVWTEARDDSLSLLFILLSFLLFIKVLRGQGRIVFYYFVSVMSFILALLTKEVVIIFPALLGLYILCFIPGSKWKEAVHKTLPFWVASLLYFVLRFVIMGKGFIARLSGSRCMMEPANLFTHIGYVFKTFVFYFKQLVLPLRMVPDHSFSIPASFWQRDVLLSTGIILLLVVFIIIGIRKLSSRKEYGFCLFWLIIALLPAANIYFARGTAISNTRLYLPSLGWCLLLGIIINRLFIQYRKSAYLTMALLVSFYSASTIFNASFWKDEVSLWEYNVKASPTERSYHELGSAYLERGESEKALRVFEKLAGLKPEQPDIQLMMGNIYQRVGDKAKAIAAYERAIQKKAVYPPAHTYLGIAYRRRGELKKAAYEFNVATLLDPENIEAYNELGILWDMSGHHQAAIFTYQKALNINPDYYPSHFNLGFAYEHKNQYEEAINEYKKTIQLDPNYAEPYYRLAFVFGKYLGDKEKAKYYWEKYLKFGPPPKPKYTDEIQKLLQ